MRTNFLAVFVAALAYWLLGALWYSVLFQKQWIALEHMDVGHMQTANPAIPFIIAFLLELLIAYSLAQLCIWRNANTMGRGAAVGVLVWIGFIGPITLMTYMFEMRPRALYAINEFYPLFGTGVDGRDSGSVDEETCIVVRLGFPALSGDNGGSQNSEARLPLDASMA